MKNEALVIKRTYDAPVEVVWEALTDREAMKKWYFDISGFKAEKGTEFSFMACGGDPDNEIKYVHLCKVTAVEKHKKLAYTWRYEGEEGDSIVTFELTPDGNKTTLTLTHEGLETFPAQPAFARNNFEEGWTFILGTSLANYLSQDAAQN